MIGKEKHLKLSTTGGTEDARVVITDMTPVLSRISPSPPWMVRFFVMDRKKYQRKDSFLQIDHLRKKFKNEEEAMVYVQATIERLGWLF